MLSLVIGTTLAWLNERTNTPFKSLVYALSVVPLVIPGILFVTAWIMLASPKIGVLNLLLQRAFDTDHVFFDVYTLPGMMWVDGIQHAPLAFLLMSAAFRSMDPSLEESALMSGASILQVARRVTLRLAFPGPRRVLPDPLRALDRILREPGAAGPAGGHSGFHLVDL